MRKRAITYWLIPAEPARSFFERMIADLARRYNAPVFEPHVTIHVGLHRLDVAEEVITKATVRCGPIEAKTLRVRHSCEFTKTLFVQFALNEKLLRLNKIIRNAAEDSSDYRLKPHLSLLYKKLSALPRRRLANSINLPYSDVIFDSIKAVLCASPTRSRTDVEAWRVLATKPLGR